MRFPHRRALVALASFVAVPAWLLGARPADAQVLSGRAVLLPVQTPASHTLVVMVSDSARVAALAHTDSAGVFALQPGRPGTYRLAFFRARESSVVTPAIRLDSAADVEREFQIPGDSGAHVPLFFAGDVIIRAYSDACKRRRR